MYNSNLSVVAVVSRRRVVGLLDLWLSMAPLFFSASPWCCCSSLVSWAEGGGVVGVLVLLWLALVMAPPASVAATSVE